MLQQLVRIVTTGFKRLVWIGWILLVRFVFGILDWLLESNVRHSSPAGPSWSCWRAVFKPVWHIPVPSVQWINSWCWTEELPETCRVSCRSKFGKLVHLVDFYYKETLSLFSSLSENDQASYPYKMTGKITTYDTMWSYLRLLLPWSWRQQDPLKH